MFGLLSCLLLLLKSADGDQNLPCGHIFDDKKFDLAPLTRPASSIGYTFNDLAHNNTVYHFNICDISNLQCAAKSGMMCKFNGLTGALETVLARWGAGSTPTWLLEGETLFLVFRNGDACGDVPRVTMFEFLCNPLAIVASPSSVKDDEKECTTTITIPTLYACPVLLSPSEVKTEPGDSGGGETPPDPAVTTPGQVGEREEAGLSFFFKRVYPIYSILFSGSDLEALPLRRYWH